MSQIKIIKQDVINSLKHNLTENNIEDLIKEFTLKSNLQMDINITKTNYMWYYYFSLL
jgi:hypothetical protein